MKLNLALAQINTRLGDVEANLEKHLALIQEAQTGGADLLVFPELSLTGYVLQDLASAVALRPTADDPVFRQSAGGQPGSRPGGGFCGRRPPPPFLYCRGLPLGGRVVHVHHKVYLPTYGLFDEGRFFAWGDAVRAFDTRFGRVGMLICEDFWHASPPYLLWLDGADLLLFTSASPGRGLNSGPQLESARWVEQINQAYASLFTAFVAHANRVGFEDGLNFWGGSTVYRPEWRAAGEGPYHQEGPDAGEIDLNQLHRTRARLPLLRDERTALVLRELNRIQAR